jgi:hypothetical protein
MKFIKYYTLIIAIVLIFIVLFTTPCQNDEKTINTGKEIIAKKDFEGWSLLTVRDQKNIAHWAVPADVAEKYKIGDLFDGESWINASKDQSVNVFKLIEKQEKEGKLNLSKEIGLIQEEKDELKELIDTQIKDMKPIVVPAN